MRSEPLIHQLVREKTDLPFINQLWIKETCSLLQNTNKKMIEIAFLLGFNNLSFFNRCFRNLLNQNPSEYRKINCQLYHLTIISF